MFIYLFLIAAVATPSELPTPDTHAKELQELVAIFTQEEPIICQDCVEQIEQVDEKQIETAITSAHAEELVVIPPTTTPIIIKNAIEPSMLAYKHWTGTYSPDTFTIAVNGTEVALDSHITLSTNTTSVAIRYDYSFMKGMRSGAKTVSYQLHENITQASITFSWKDSWKVLLDNGTAIKEEVEIS